MPHETQRAIAHALAWLDTQALTIHDLRRTARELPEKTPLEDVARHLARAYDAPEHLAEILTLVELLQHMPAPQGEDEGETVTMLVEAPVSRWDEFSPYLRRGRPAWVT